MKSKLKIKSEDFINWFFKSGADQDQESEALSLGYSVIEELLDGKVTITPQSILDGCEPVVIPIRIIEGFEDDNTFAEIDDAIAEGKISNNFEIELI
jgi:hypothetical protein